MKIIFASFGYKYKDNGVIPSVLTFDCRVLKNPHDNPKLRDLTGKDPAVVGDVLNRPEARRWLTERMIEVRAAVAKAKADGLEYAYIAFGCHGGRHRSVVMAEEAARRWNLDNKVDVAVTRHFDLHWEA